MSYAGRFAVVATLALALGSARAGTKEEVSWRLAAVKVTDPGQTQAVPADPETGFPGGTLTTGLVIEARVVATRGALLPAGSFKLVGSAFRPDADMPGQKAGLWDVQGSWTIVDAKADPKALKARHNPFVVKGRIRAALPFNPAEGGTSWSAAATIPSSPAAGRWVRRSTGTLNLDGSGAGDLALLVDAVADGK